jgi:hypothetical protein
MPGGSWNGQSKLISPVLTHSCCEPPPLLPALPPPEPAPLPPAGPPDAPLPAAPTPLPALPPFASSLQAALAPRVRSSASARYLFIESPLG